MTDNLLNKNANIIEKRWPFVYKIIAEHQSIPMNVTVKGHTLNINNIQLTSSIDRKSEAIIQTKHLKNAKSITLYGIGLGDCIVELLTNKKTESINIIILNIDVLLLSLSYIDHSDWLTNAKISLFTWHDITKVSKPFAALPSELVLADDDACVLRDRVEQELNTDFINQKFTKAENLSLNKNIVEKSLTIADIPKPNVNEIFIAASGPTLESHIEYLQNNNCFIIALDASVKTLLSYNILPSLIISIDAVSFQLFKGLSSDYFKNIPLIFFPNVQPELLAYWPGKLYCSYSQTPMYDKYKSIQGKPSLFSAGSVIHPAIDLAVYLNAKDIVLLGADFSFTRNKSHSHGQNGESSFSLPFDMAQHWVKNYSGEKVPTLKSFISYLRDLELFIEKNSTINFYNGSNEGAKISGTQLWRS